MKLQFLEFTAIGDRKKNQDYMAHIANKEYGLFVVADGLGGHHAGEKASEFFCKGVIKFANDYHKKISHKRAEPSELFNDWISDAIEEMKALFVGDLLAENSHTTCAILYLDDDLVMTAHCGDSRIYRMNPEEILWRTEDHSLPQILYNEGRITEMEIAHHPGQNQLTRSINIKKPDRVEIKMHPPIKTDETFVICTDGFWGNVKQDEILQLADLSADKEKLAKLTRLCIYRGSGKSDNVTVFSVRCKRR